MLTWGQELKALFKFQRSGAKSGQRTYLSWSVDVPDGEQIAPWSRLGPDLSHHELPPLVAGAYEYPFEHGDDILGRHHVPIACTSFLQCTISYHVGCVGRRREVGQRGRSSCLTSRSNHNINQRRLREAWEIHVREEQGRQAPPYQEHHHRLSMLCYVTHLSHHSCETPFTTLGSH